MISTTLHWKERHSRNEFIRNEIGIGTPIRTFKWDKGHPNGPELHTITDNGIIIVRNERTGKLITTLIARPGQIHRYYRSVNEVAPTYLINIALEHTKNGYHNM